jgi:hypothetical protein
MRPGGCVIDRTARRFRRSRSCAADWFAGACCAVGLEHSSDQHHAHAKHRARSKDSMNDVAHVISLTAVRGLYNHGVVCSGHQIGEAAGRLLLQGISAEFVTCHGARRFVEFRGAADVALKSSGDRPLPGRCTVRGEVLPDPLDHLRVHRERVGFLRGLLRIQRQRGAVALRPERSRIEHV